MVAKRRGYPPLPKGGKQPAPRMMSPRVSSPVAPAPTPGFFGIGSFGAAGEALSGKGRGRSRSRTQSPTSARSRTTTKVVKRGAAKATKVVKRGPAKGRTK